MSNGMNPKNFDCVVIGGGHAGVEAAHAAAKIGAKTCLVTISTDTIAKMSCNPAIGGLGKGQIAREVDALGGLMGLATDATGIQFRLLNRSKGPAVRAPRAQADKYKYKNHIRMLLEQTPNLTIAEAVVSQIITEKNTVRAVKCTDGRIYNAPTVILTTGTFLRGLMHIGTQHAGGRLDEPAANLDPEARHIFFQLLAARQAQVAMLISSHRLDEVAALVNRVVELDQGRIVLDDHVADQVDMSSLLDCRLTLVRASSAFAETVREWGFVDSDEGRIWTGQVSGPDRLRFLGVLSRYAALLKGIQLEESSEAGEMTASLRGTK